MVRLRPPWCLLPAPGAPSAAGAPLRVSAAASGVGRRAAAPPPRAPPRVIRTRGALGSRAAGVQPERLLLLAARRAGTRLPTVCGNTLRGNTLLRARRRPPR
jgi:hypothetical protein